MSGEVVQFPGQDPEPAATGKSSASSDGPEFSDLIRQVLMSIPDAVTRLDLVIDDDIGVTQTSGETARDLIADLIGELLDQVERHQRLRIRASAMYQPQLARGDYPGIVEGHYALLLLDSVQHQETASATLPREKSERSIGGGPQVAALLSTFLQERVAEIGGRLDSSAQTRTEFSVALYLPLRGQDSPESALTPSQGSVPHVLLVDDDEQVQLSLAAMLKALGYRVTMRGGGAEALDTLRRNPRDYQLLLCDMTMPRISGDEVVTRLQSLRPDLPVVLMTGFSLGAAAHPAPAVKGFLQKPFSLDQLGAAVALALGLPARNGKS